MKIKIILFFILSLLVLNFYAPAMADVKGQLQCGINAAAGAGNTNGDCVPSNATPGTDLNDLIRKIINIMSALVGAIAVVMIIVAGFRFVASAGSESAVTGAKKTISYALIGLVVVAIAQVIVHFVLNNITSTTSSSSSSNSTTPPSPQSGGSARAGATQ